MQKSVIVENLSKNYFKKEAVKEISFTINENEILGLLGPNGCGKTTTIAMMLGLLKPSNGRVVIHGLDIKKISKVLKRKLNYTKNKSIKVPGQSKFHYSPGIPIRLNAKKHYIDEAFVLIQKRKKFDKNYFYLSKNKNLKEAGKNLYKTLRNIKRLKFKKIAVEKIPNIGIGRTINDRLKRASKR